MRFYIKDLDSKKIDVVTSDVEKVEEEKKDLKQLAAELKHAAGERAKEEEDHLSGDFFEIFFLKYFFLKYFFFEIFF